MISQNIRNHSPYLGLTLLLYIMLVLGSAYVNDWHDPPFSQGSDLNVHIPYALKLDDPRLYDRDPVFGSYDRTAFGYRLDYLAFALFLGELMPILGAIRPTLIFLSFVLGLVYVIGIYGLTYSLFHNSLAGVIAAFLGSLDYSALGGVGLGFTPAAVLPRNFVVAASPTLIILFLRWKSSRRLWVLCALLGLMANVHILASIQLSLILTLALALTSKPSVSRLRHVFIGAVLWLACASPVLLCFLPSVSEVMTVTPEEASIINSRYAFATRPSPIELARFMTTLLPLALLGALGLRQALRRHQVRLSRVRAYLCVYLIVLLLPWIGQIINAITLSLMQLELLRVTRYYFMLNLAPAGMLLSSWLQGRKRLAFVLAPIALLSIMILSRPLVGVVLVEMGVDWFSSTDQANANITHNEKALSMPWDWDDFSDLCRWVDSNTPVESLFLAPVDWNPFRVYARRGLPVSWKGTSWPGWAASYTAVQRLYSLPDAGAFTDAALEYDVDYIVVMSGLALPVLELVYENDHYIVYKAR